MNDLNTVTTIDEHANDGEPISFHAELHTPPLRPESAVSESPDVDPPVPVGPLHADSHLDAGSHPEKNGSSAVRPMQKCRFLTGLLLSTVGIGLMLLIGFGATQTAGINGRLSLPVVGVCMITGVMLLGGGFGIMATASPTFDDDEFDRLMRAGDRKRRVETSQHSSSGLPKEGVGS